MRHFTKNPPPANVSPPGQAACTLAQAEVQYLGGLPSAQNPSRYARVQFDCMHKPALRAEHYVEQRYVCVFCERAVGEGNQTPPIDHWRPLNLNLNDVFKWENLHLSCASYDTCDNRKQGNPLKALATDPDLPYPTQFAYEDVLGFTSGGNVYVRTDVSVPPAIRTALELAIEDQVVGGRKTTSTLNLNSPALRDARAAAIEDEENAFRAALGGAAPTPDQREARVAALLAAARLPEFVSIRVAAISERLGVGR